MYTLRRSWDFCYGHRVLGHEGKCRNLHGHNGRLTVELICERLDSLGRLIDFAEVKRWMIEFLDTEWDHRMLIYAVDPLAERLVNLDPTVRVVDFNPTVENMSMHALENIKGRVRAETDGRVWVSFVSIDETQFSNAGVING